VGDVVSILTQAGWNLVALLTKGGLVMVPLLTSSILSLAVVLERCRFWQRFRKHEDGGTILSLVAAGHLAQAMQVARASQHPVAHVLLTGLEHQYPVPGMAMEAAARAELHRLKRYLPMLDTISTLAPLLGLLGTITGMISAFGIVSCHITISAARTRPPRISLRSVPHAWKSCSRNLRCRRRNKSCACQGESPKKPVSRSSR
jgi:biopolymer transport protein ExbB/TolQ